MKNDFPALIFDFDGTLVQTERVHMIAWRETAGLVNRMLPEQFGAMCTGRQDRLIAHELIEEWGLSLKPEELRALKNECYARHAPELPHWVPGARESIRRWAAHHPIALATSARRGDVRRILQNEGLWDCFDVTCTIEDVTHPKPDPEVYRLAVRLLGVPVEQCWVFEDSPAGVKAARGAGLRVIGLTTSLDTAALVEAQHHMDDFSAPEVIEAWFDAVKPGSATPESGDGVMQKTNSARGNSRQ